MSLLVTHYLVFFTLTLLFACYEKPVVCEKSQQIRPKVFLGTGLWGCGQLRNVVGCSECS